ARRILAACDGNSGERNSGDARPSKQTGRHQMARHVVTHSYATNLDFEINQPRVNTRLRITEPLRVVTQLIKMQHPARYGSSFTVLWPAPAEAARNEPRSASLASGPFATW